MKIEYKSRIQLKVAKKPDYMLISNGLIFDSFF